MPSRFTCFLVLAILPPALLAPAGDAADPCADAEHDLLTAWDASGRALTPGVARAIRTWTDACPRPAAPSLESACSPEACAGTQPRPYPHACGVLGASEVERPNTELAVWYQAPSAGIYKRDVDHGLARGAYSPSTGEITYHHEGTRYGLDASGAGTATLWVHGVPLPGTGHAAAGCDALDPSGLCWARGDGALLVDVIGLGIYMDGVFTTCI